VTYRHPSVLAAEAVTVDHVSGGRLDFGIGAAWFGQEHEELGIDFPSAGERLTRLDEALQAITQLMTEDEATFKGRYYRLAGARYRPFPVQRPHPPFWVGGGGERRLLPIAARHADVWHGFGSSGELARKSRLLDRLCEEAGRDPGSVARSTSLSLSEPWDEVRRRADDLRQAGFSILIADWPSEGQARVEEFVAAVMPQL
jgi:alkanesulfonate monooxygenase SsuD/methylene tetrahydromethanopterin reductase-like flavin-dependent oxidoreductase (luciferase family)